jgi:hypothetical protein
VRAVLIILASSTLLLILPFVVFGQTVPITEGDGPEKYPPVSVYATARASPSAAVEPYLSELGIALELGDDAQAEALAEAIVAAVSGNSNDLIVGGGLMPSTTIYGEPWETPVPAE